MAPRLPVIKPQPILIAVGKALTRLKRAREALDRAKDSRSYEAFGEAWTDLLIHLNSVHTLIEQGIRGHPKGEAWFGRKKHLRRTDPLLSYLHQARNSDEHGLEPVTGLEPGRVRLAGTSGGVKLDSLVVDEHGNMTISGLSDPKGGDAFIEVTPSRAVLVAVRNSKFGDEFPPPQEHLGQPIPDNNPIAVAELGLAYHELLVEEAKDFVG